jgi:hypothetical protein
MSARQYCKAAHRYSMILALYVFSLPGIGQEPATANPSGSGGGISASQLSNANNPLADMDALNFQNYYSPSLYGVPN